MTKRNPQPDEICSESGCGRFIASLGLCSKHYNRQYLYGRLYKSNDGRRDRPLYIAWLDRKADAVAEWQDFWTFEKDVPPKPSENHFLVKLKKDQVFGPQNFVWEEHLRKRTDETHSQWWARKAKTKDLKNPGMERNRSLQKTFGITTEQFEKMLEAQGHACAACFRQETRKSGLSEATCRLSIDHCHASGKIRGLLCSKCNAALGYARDSIEILESLVVYLEKAALFDGWFDLKVRNKARKIKSQICIDPGFYETKQLKGP